MLTAVLGLLLYHNRDTKLEGRGVSSGSKTSAGEESGRWVWSWLVCCELSVLNFVCCVPSDEESVLMVWNGMLPMEVKDLKRHCDKREQIAVRMREQFQAETLVCIHSFSFQMAFVYFFSCHSDAVNEAAPNQKRKLHLNFSHQRRFIIWINVQMYFFFALFCRTSVETGAEMLWWTLPRLF